MQNQNIQTKEFAEFALEHFPDEPWLHIHNLEDNDAWRVRHFFSSKFRHVFQSGIMIQDGDGFWHRMDMSDAIHAIVRDLIVRARIYAGEEIEERPVGDLVLRVKYSDFIDQNCPLSSLHVVNVTRQLIQAIFPGKESGSHLPSPYESVSPEDFDRRSENPIIPISFANGVLLGGSVDLRTAEYMTPEKTGKLLMLCHKWGMPLFNENIADSQHPGKLAMENAIENRWKDDLLTRLCRHLFGISKNIDVVTAPTNWGKSTLITALEKALPGMVGRLEAYKAFSKQGDRFSQIAALLTEKLLVFVDEAGQDDPERNAEIPPGALNALTDDLLQVEKKFENNRTIPRLGTAILIGHTWAAVNSSAQGVDTRIRWAYEADPGPSMTEEDRALILSDPGIEFMRFWIMKRCREMWELSEDGKYLDDLTMSAENRESVAAFKVARGDDMATALIDAFEVGSQTDWVPSASLISTLESVSDDKVGPKTLKAKVKIAFHHPHIRPGRARDKITREQIRVWYGLKKRV